MKDFVIAVGQEEQAQFHGGAMKAPKVLADIVESVAAAVYVDCGFDLKAFWLVCCLSFDRLYLFVDGNICQLVSKT